MKDQPLHLAKAIFFAYFDHRATPLEHQTVESWLNTPEGTSLYFTYLDEWEREHLQFQPDLEQAQKQYTQFMQRVTPADIQQDPAQFQPPQLDPPVNSRPLGWLRQPLWRTLAASVLLIAGLWSTTDYWYYTSLITGNHQIRILQLPDASGVVLGPNSSLRYARYSFGWGERRVWLTGEAQFRVTHQSNDSQFRVQTPDQTVVEVLGTVFVVNSRRNTTRVTLKTGRIRMSVPHQVKPLLLVPGDVVTVSEQGQTRHEHPDAQPTQVTWHDHRFVFQDTPLTEIVTQLHDVFGVDVSIAQPDLMSRTITGTFQAETADDLLQALSLMMNVKVGQTPAGYTLSQ